MLIKFSDAYTQVLVAGDALCGIPDYEDRLGKPHVIALQESLLLELTRDRLKALKAAGGGLGIALEAYLEQMQQQAISHNRLGHVEGFTDPETTCGNS